MYYDSTIKQTNTVAQNNFIIKLSWNVGEEN